MFFPQIKNGCWKYSLQTLGDVRWVQTIDFPHGFFNYIPPYARLPTWMRGKIIEKHQLFWCTFLASDFQLGTWLWSFAHFLMVHLWAQGVELWPKSCVFCWPRLYPLSPRCHGPSGFYPKSCTPQIWFRLPNFAIRHTLVDWALGILLPGLLGITIPPFSRETLHQLAWDGRWFFSWLT